MGYTLTELEQKIADYKTQIADLEQASRTAKAGLDYLERLLEATED